MPAGRPSIYTDELAETICNGLESGLSLPKVLAADNMPCIPTVYRWLEKNEEFRNRYMRARELQAGTLIDSAVDEADFACDKDNASAAKVRSDARFRAAEMLAPHKYGKHMHLSGKDGGPVESEGRMIIEVRTFAGDKG